MDKTFPHFCYALEWVLSQALTDWRVFIYENKPTDFFRSLVSEALDTCVANEILLARYTHFFRNVIRPELSFERSYEFTGNETKCAIRLRELDLQQYTKNSLYRLCTDGCFEGVHILTEYKLLPSGIAIVDKISSGSYSIPTLASAIRGKQAESCKVSPFTLVSTPEPHPVEPDKTTYIDGTPAFWEKLTESIKTATSSDNEFSMRGEKALGILGDTTLSVADRAKLAATIMSGNTAKEATPSAESACAYSFYQTRAATESANDTQSISEPAATANDKLCRFLEKRPECRYWTSVDLGKQIGVADATVRKTVMWQVLTKERESIKKENKNKMALNSEYLSQAERKKHENSGREDRRET